MALANKKLSGQLTNQSGESGVFYLDVRNNSLTGGIPTGWNPVRPVVTLLLGSNNLLGDLPWWIPQRYGSKQVDLSSNDFRCSKWTPPSPALISLGGPVQLASLGLPCAIPPELRNLTSLRYLHLEFWDQTIRILDLSSVPPNCSYVSLTGRYPGLTEVVFWDGCTTGCVVNLIGTGAKLSSNTKRQICLGRISVLTDGDNPSATLVTPPTNGAWSFGGDEVQLLSNGQGVYSLKDPFFFEKIDLGPSGSAYTGVGFVRVWAIFAGTRKQRWLSQA
jgi:hypothetical protein